MNQNFHGLVQRLVQKEKHVLQLQAELDKFNAQNPTEGREAVSGANGMHMYNRLILLFRMSAQNGTAIGQNGTR